MRAQSILIEKVDLMKSASSARLIFQIHQPRGLNCHLNPWAQFLVQTIPHKSAGLSNFKYCS